MRYFLDCEFDGWRGDLLSLGLVPEDAPGLYVTLQVGDVYDPWVREHVAPHLDIPLPEGVRIHRNVHRAMAGRIIADYLKDDSRPYIVTDWPDDIRYFCEIVISGPGTMVSIPSLRFEMARVDAYPTTLPDAIQHHAWWDAAALRHLLLP